MSLCLRPVTEKWGEPLTYSLAHDDVVNLLCAVAAWADAGDASQREYGDLTVVTIEKGGRFLDLLSAGPQAIYRAREADGCCDDLTAGEIEALEQMAAMASAWRRSIDPEDGFLRIYVD